MTADVENDVHDPTSRSRKQKRVVERLHTSIARELGEAITSGRIMPGDTLTGEVASSTARSVSRTAYREAVRILAAKGLIESRTRIGTRVSPSRSWSLLDPDVLNWFLKEAPDQGFIRDLFELRRVVEPAAAMIAAERATPPLLAAMREALSVMEGARLSSEAGRTADVAFHTLLLEATGNSVLLALSSSIGASIHWAARYKHSVLRSPRNPVPEHQAVLDAVAAREPEAARDAMSELVRRALVDMEDSLRAAAAGAAVPVPAA